MCQIRLANLICMWLMFLGILVTGITMCIPRETLIDLFNDDEETQRCNSNGRDGYQSIKQNDFDGKIQIIKQDEPNVSLIEGGINGNGNGPSKQPNKLKGREETFGFSKDELQKLAEEPNYDNNRLNHVV